MIPELAEQFLDDWHLRHMSASELLAFLATCCCDSGDCHDEDCPRARTNGLRVACLAVEAFSRAWHLGDRLMPALLEPYQGSKLHVLLNWPCDGCDPLSVNKHASVCPASPDNRHLVNTIRDMANLLRAHIFPASLTAAGLIAAMRQRGLAPLSMASTAAGTPAT